MASSSISAWLSVSACGSSERGSWGPAASRRRRSRAQLAPAWRSASGSAWADDRVAVAVACPTSRFSRHHHQDHPAAGDMARQLVIYALSVTRHNDRLDGFPGHPHNHLITSSGRLRRGVMIGKPATVGCTAAGRGDRKGRAPGARLHSL